MVFAVDSVLALDDATQVKTPEVLKFPQGPVNREAHRAETHPQQGQRITQQGQEMDAARGQSVLPYTLHKRSIVEALAGLLTLDFVCTTKNSLMQNGG